MVVLESDTEMESDTELSLILGLEVRILVGKVEPSTIDASDLRPSRCIWLKAEVRGLLQ